MDTLKIQILLMIALVGNELPLQGMQAVYSRGTQAARRGASARSSQSWGSWLRSKLTRSQQSAAAQPRSYSTNNLPEIKEDKQASPQFGWLSMIPGSATYKSKQLVTEIDQLIKKMQQKEEITLQDLNHYESLRDQYAELVSKEDYNPIKDHSLFMVKTVVNCLRYGNIDYGSNQIIVLNKLYEFGVRLSQEEFRNILKNTGWDKIIKSKVDQMDNVHDNENLTIENIGSIAYSIVTMDEFFKSFGMDITPYFGRMINIDFMKWLSQEWLNIKSKTNIEMQAGISHQGPMYASARLDNMPMSYLRSRVFRATNMSRIDDEEVEMSVYRDYPIGYGRHHAGRETNPSYGILRNMRAENYKYLNDFLDIARRAGFFRSSGEGIAYLPSSSFDDAYNVLMQNGSYEKNEGLYRSFMQEYAPDKLLPKVQSGEMSQEKYNYMQSKIAELNAARSKQQRASE